MDCVPEGIVNEVIDRFRDAYAIYLYGGSLDCSGGDVDVAVFTRSPPRGIPAIEGNVDLHIFNEPHLTLFFVYIIKAGHLIYGSPLSIDVDLAIRNELDRVGERVFIFLNSDDEVMVCKSLKELMYLLAAVKCSIDRSSNWYRMVKCLEGLGIRAPIEFKNCLNPPDVDMLRRVGEPVLRSIVRELGVFVSNI